MKPPRNPLFLAPGPYRRRRLAEAARLVPVVGLFLFLLPVLWQPGGAHPRDTAPDGMYLFAVWAGLIVTAGLISRWLTPEDDAGERDEDAG